MNRLEAVHEIIALADREWLQLQEITVDSQSFDQMLRHLSGMLLYAPGTNSDFDFKQTEFVLNTPYCAVKIKKGKNKEES